MPKPVRQERHDIVALLLRKSRPGCYFRQSATAAGAKAARLVYLAELDAGSSHSTDIGALDADRKDTKHGNFADLFARPDRVAGMAAEPPPGVSRKEEAD